MARQLQITPMIMALLYSALNYVKVCANRTRLVCYVADVCRSKLLTLSCTFCSIKIQDIFCIQIKHLICGMQYL